MQTQTQTLRMERLFDATPAQLWAAWTRPEHVAKWWNPAAGIDAAVHELDLRVGGLLRLTMTVPHAVGFAGTDKFPVHGTFVRIDPPRELVLRMAEGGDEGFVAMLTVRFDAEGARTRMRFEVDGLPDAETRAMLEEGWAQCFANLAAHLPKIHPKEAAIMEVPATPAIRLERTLACTPQDLFDAFTRPEQLAKWISPFPGLDAEVHALEPRVGGRISFTMVDPQGNRYPEEHGVFEVVSPREIVQYQANDKRDDIFKGHPQRLRATFEPVGDKTRLVLEVYGMPPQIPIDAAAQGFGATLDKLAALVEKPKAAAKQLRLERTFDATPEQMWAAWTKPELYAQWFNPCGIPLVIREFDVRVGGRISFDMPQPDGNKNPQEGVFHVVSPYTNLVSGSPDKSFLVDVRLVPQGQRTHLVIVTTGLPPEFHEMATAGWGMIFDRLAGVLKAQA